MARVHHYLAAQVEYQHDGHPRHSWKVDCEYNLDHGDVKRIREDRPQRLEANHKKRNATPDIVIHERRTDSNLLIVEFKNKERGIRAGGDDDEKMKLWMSKYRYEVGSLLAFEADGFRRQCEPLAKVVWYSQQRGRGEEHYIGPDGLL